MSSGINKVFHDIVTMGRVGLMLGGVFMYEEYKAAKCNDVELEEQCPPKATFKKVKNGHRVTLHVDGWKRPIVFSMNEKRDLMVRTIALDRTIKHFKNE